MTDLEDARVNHNGWQVLLLAYGGALAVAWLLTLLPCHNASRLLLRGVFGVASAYHLREDMGSSFAWSLAIHTAALASVAVFGLLAPWRVMVAWLSLWHAPNHYVRFFAAPNRNIRAGVGLMLASVAAGLCVWKLSLFVHLPEWFVVGSIIAHAICTEKWKAASQVANQ